MNTFINNVFLFLVLSIYCYNSQIIAQNISITADSVVLQNGDLLFQDLDCGDFCDAIEEVTQGFRSTRLSHIGLVFKRNDSLFVVEAISKGVSNTPLPSFLSRSIDTSGKPKVILGRLKKDYQYLVPDAINEALKLTGKPYDEIFDINNDSYYCSEIIYWAFLRAYNNQPFFELQPMTFISPHTGKTYQIWIDYYKKLNIPIPEGMPGINPGGISRSKKIDIFFPYGKPDGLK